MNLDARSAQYAKSTVHAIMKRETPLVGKLISALGLR